MRICDRAPEFNRPDPADRTICLGEVDIFAGDPTVTAPSHQYRLTLRRRWSDGKWTQERIIESTGPGEWELVRIYHLRPKTKAFEEVVTHGTLTEVLDRANAEWKRAWGPAGREDDAPCLHEDGARSSRCDALTRGYPPAPPEP